MFVVHYLLLSIPLIFCFSDDLEDVKHLGGCVVHGDILCHGRFVRQSRLTPRGLSDELFGPGLFDPPPRTIKGWDLWNVIQYTVGKSAEQYAGEIKMAFKDITVGTCVVVIKKDEKDLKNKPYIRFSGHDGRNCYADALGYQGPHPHRVYIGTECTISFQIQHAILHVLGFLHEHNRLDRDKFVAVFKPNIITGFEWNFEKLEADWPISLPKYNYDVLSTMHVPVNFYAKNPNLPTLVPLSANVNPLLFAYREHYEIRYFRTAPASMPKAGFIRTYKFRFKGLSANLSDIDRAKINAISCRHKEGVLICDGANCKITP